MPKYLLYHTTPGEADAVVVFGGSNSQARHRQADELISNGWADFSIIPNVGEILDARKGKKQIDQERTKKIASVVSADFRRPYVEQTHIDVLQAQKLMQHIGVKRAIFVSSPYHMRRIQIITDTVFDEESYDIAFVPTAYEPPHEPWFMNWKDTKWVFSEWAKIIWFLLYSPLLK